MVPLVFPKSATKKKGFLKAMHPREHDAPKNTTSGTEETRSEFFEKGQHKNGSKF